MKTLKIVLAALLLCVLFSCATREPVEQPGEVLDPVTQPVEAAKKVAATLASGSDPVKSILESFEKADIVFIGPYSHRLLNETLFQKENLQRFYDAGVRYILAEGGGGRLDDSPLFSDEELLDRAILLYYPWDYVGVRYKSRDWGDLSSFQSEIYRINVGKTGSDAIKEVGLEFGRLNVAPDTMEPFELLNYRDEYMANMAFKYIDNAAPGEKFLVLAGGAHGLAGRAGPHSDPEVWKPMGLYLKEKYKERYVSYSYHTLDEDIKMNESYQAMLQSQEWQSIPNSPRLLKPEQAFQLAVELLESHYSGPFFDWYIVDKAGIKGVMYSYVLFDPDVLKVIIADTKRYEADIALLSSEGRLNYEDGKLYYDINDFLKNVYYLRLSFGDYFPYDFWNPQMPLKDALAQLESAVLADGVNPQDFLRFPVPPIETMRDYHDNIEFFASLQNVALMQEEGSATPSNIEKIFKRSEPYMQKAHELFPYELWTDYWYAKMYTTLDNHEKAYPYLQTLLNNPVLYSMQIYPEVLELAVQSAERLGKQDQSVEYQAILDGLTNEFGIDTSIFSPLLSTSSLNM